ncbi:hypothetical protein GJAV_G00159960 [Gymnothorax javanicus]|nr:hypothetical protein GJAV_G00159960 [Gymnothorax javanicus]
MAELSTEVPQKKRKFEAQSVDQESSRGQIPVSRRSSTELLLQMPPNTNTCLPVWEYMSAAQVDVQWNVTPYRITIQITPLNTTEKVLSNDQPVPQPSSQSGPQHSTPLAHASLPDPSSSFMTSPCGASYPNRAFSPFAFSPGDCITSTSADEYEVTDLLFQPAPKAKWLQQACFHTLPSDEICICDQFLLGQCQNGFDCRLHHTPYPFHWQLRRRDTYQWVSTSHSAQVKLEKLYCDIKRDSVRLQEMADEFTLQFDTMNVENSEKYDKARRLSNSSSAERNPHFYTQWNNYWWNDYKWDKYRNDVSTVLLEKMAAGESSCRFHIGKQEYEVDFLSMTQRNLTTGFQRRVRRRPTFRSPFSLKALLKTVVLSEAPKNVEQVLPSLSVDPLQEFSSWYPPVWTLCPDQGFSLVEVPPNSKAYQSIHCLFHSTLSETKLEIVSIQQVQNIFLWDKYRRQKKHMQSRSAGQTRSLERHLFHGTNEDSAEEICLNNFDPRVAGKNGAVYGQGSYFARDASYSNAYAHASCEESYQYMFLAKVLVGMVTVGKTKFRRPPYLSSGNPGHELYDTCVDRKRNPSIFVIFDSCQCYPYYLIKYRAVSGTVKIFE